MATYIKIKKENMTPEHIQGTLFSFYNAAHKFHLDTERFEIHKTLGKLYEGLQGFADEISEKLMGYMDGKRIGKIKIDEVPEYSDAAVKKLAKDIKDFAYDLYEWAGEINIAI